MEPLVHRGNFLPPPPRLFSPAKRGSQRGWAGEVIPKFKKSRNQENRCDTIPPPLGGAGGGHSQSLRKSRKSRNQEIKKSRNQENRCDTIPPPWDGPGRPSRSSRKSRKSRNQEIKKIVVIQSPLPWDGPGRPSRSSRKSRKSRNQEIKKIVVIQSPPLPLGGAGGGHSRSRGNIILRFEKKGNRYLFSF